MEKKKVILLGDSIRIGYDEYAVDALKMAADVYYPQENCRFAAALFRDLPKWVRESGFGENTDVIHWNAGHWDTLIQLENVNFSSPEVYGEYIGRICKRIKILCPNAVQIFATSTPENIEVYADGAMRLNKDIDLYNRIAIEILEREGVLINDLNAFAKNWSSDYYRDEVHFNELGSKLLGQRVAQFLREKISF